MSAFSRAADALAADINLGEAVIYRAAPGGAPVSCRAIRYQRDPLADVGPHAVRQAGLVFSVRIADVASPAKGGSVEVQGVQRTIFDVQPDEDALTHRVSVR